MAFCKKPISSTLILSIGTTSILKDDRRLMSYGSIEEEEL
jgi:hypothetical protein